MNIKIVKIALLIIGAFYYSGASGQCPAYTLNNPNDNFVMNGGLLAGAGLWQVNHGTGSIETDPILLIGDPLLDPNLDVPISFIFNATNNLEADDNIVIEYQIDGAGWTNLKTYSGNTVPGAWTTYYDTIKNVPAASSAMVKVTMITNDAGELLRIKNEGICVGASLITGTSTHFVSVLPVELISFKVEAAKDRVNINWATASEKNNSHFIMERSTNGTSFTEVEKIEGAGNSSSIKYYNSTDNNPPKGNVYYRLKQMDYDGSFEYSSIVSCIMDNVSVNACKFKIFPNPCHGRCNVDLADCNLEENHIDVSVFDAMGNQVYSQIKLDEVNNSFVIDVTNNLKPGIYVVAGVSSDKQQIKEKVILKN